MIKTALVWFKTDLRIEDNETLIKAISQSQYIIPVYCFDESHFETTSYGFKKTRFLNKCHKFLKNIFSWIVKLNQLFVSKGKLNDLFYLLKGFSFTSLYSFQMQIWTSKVKCSERSVRNNPKTTTYQRFRHETQHKLLFLHRLNICDPHPIEGEGRPPHCTLLFAIF